MKQMQQSASSIYYYNLRMQDCETELSHCLVVIGWMRVGKIILLLRVENFDTHLQTCGKGTRVWQVV